MEKWVETKKAMDIVEEIVSDGVTSKDTSNSSDDDDDVAGPDTSHDKGKRLIGLTMNKEAFHQKADVGAKNMSIGVYRLNGDFNASALSSGLRDVGSSDGTFQSKRWTSNSLTTSLKKVCFEAIVASIFAEGGEFYKDVDGGSLESVDPYFPIIAPSGDLIDPS
ncbi:hypothetical protein GOBAR_AA12441 [Gossypium barbadense]|uniref:Uncharacterized protein n=1 Tax=Gossypium barbadense TaxID=3634 RepID=A0A2P5XXX4_GOSBA|nr:hypothetical protein GOBAR_AA12441 [Gossypium barbadense]